MKNRLGLPHVRGVLIGICISVMASHSVRASVSHSGPQNITDQIPKVDQIRPVITNRFAQSSADAPFRLRCDWSGNPLRKRGTGTS